MSTNNQPSFFVFEGPDGVGKTTLSKWFAEEFEKRTGREVAWFSFPGSEDGTIGNIVYTLHHTPASLGVSSIHPLAVQTLHIAAHIDAIETCFAKLISGGCSIVLDRFWWSTWVYGRLQGVNRDALDTLIEAEKLTWGKLSPTRIYLVSRAVADPSAQRRQLERFYFELAHKEERGVRVVRVQNNGSLRETQETLLASLT